MRGMGSIKSDGPGGWTTNDLGEALKAGTVSLDDVFHILPSTQLPGGPDHLSDPGSLTFHLMFEILKDALKRADLPHDKYAVQSGWNGSIQRVRVTTGDVTDVGGPYLAYKLILSRPAWPQGFVTGYEGDSPHKGDDGVHHSILVTGWDRDAMVQALRDTRAAWHNGQFGPITSSRQEGA